MLRGAWIALALGLVLLIGGGVVATLTGHTKSKVTVSEQMANLIVEKELPKMHAKGAQVRHLELKFHDTADVLIEVEGSKLGKHYQMVVAALGQPDLERSKKSGDGELFIHASKIDIRDFHFGSGPKPGDLIRRASERYLINHPGMQNLASDVAPHVEDWMKASAEKVGVLVLQHVPVYKFKTDTDSAWKNFMNWFVTASVVDAKVVGNNLEITYSVWALAGAILMVIVIGFVCIILFVGLMAMELI